MSVPNIGNEDGMVNLGEADEEGSIQNQGDDIWIEDSVDGGSRLPT